MLALPGGRAAADDAAGVNRGVDGKEVPEQTGGGSVGAKWRRASSSGRKAALARLAANISENAQTTVWAQRGQDSHNEAILSRTFSPAAHHRIRPAVPPWRCPPPSFSIFPPPEQDSRGGEQACCASCIIAPHCRWNNVCEHDAVAPLASAAKAGDSCRRATATPYRLRGLTRAVYRNSARTCKRLRTLQHRHRVGLADGGVATWHASYHCCTRRALTLRRNRWRRWRAAAYQATWRRQTGGLVTPAATSTGVARIVRICWRRLLHAYLLL